MKKNKKVIRRLGCCLLAGVVATTTVGPFNLNKKVKAQSIVNIKVDDTIHEEIYRLNKPKFLELRDLYNWCDFLDKKVYKTADDVEKGKYVTDIRLIQEKISLGTDKNGNEWLGTCIVLDFGIPYSQWTQLIPVIVNVTCQKNAVGITEGIMPKGVYITYDNKTVFAPAIEIGEGVLEGSSITKLYVPDTYKLVADKAFYKRDTLQEVLFVDEDGKTENYGSGLASIGDSAFAGCSSLKKAILPDRLFEIEDGEVDNYSTVVHSAMGENAYQDCKSLKSVTINSSKKNVVIPKGLFAGCENIDSININAKNAIICDSAFAGAGSNELKELILNCDAKIGSYSFSNNGALEHVSFNGNVEFQEITSDSGYLDSVMSFNKTFLHPSDKTTMVEFNGNTKLKLPYKCFADTGYLDKIVYGNSIESIDIGSYAFSDTGINNLEFTGKNVNISTSGLANLVNTKTITFNNTENTCLCSVFGTDEGSNFSSVKEVIINSKTVDLGAFERSKDKINLVLGNEVSLFSWEPSKQEYKVDGIANVYITNCDTDITLGTHMPNGDYIVYGYPNTRYKEYIDALVSKVKWEKYVTELQAWNAQDLGDTPTMVKSTGFDPTKIKVVAQLADKTEKILSYSEDGKTEGYTLDEDSKKKIEEALKSEGNSRVSVAINYCGATLTKSILFVPKEVESFTLAPKESISFVEGMQVDASQFTIADVKYNDGTTESAVDSKEVSVRLKSGQTKLASGTNTVIVSYKGMEKQIEVVASAKKITKVHATLKSQDKKYYPGDTVTKDDITVTVTYDNGEVVSDYKEFTISNNRIPYKKADTVAVDISAGEIKDTVFVAPIKVACLSANYLGTGVTEGNEINKKDISVSILYSDGTAKVLADEEYNLIYATVVAGMENVVTVVWKEDSTKTGCFKVIGQKATGTISPTPTGTSEPAPITPVPTASVPTSVPAPTGSVNPIPTATESNAPLETPSQTVIPKEDTTIPNGDATKLQESKLTVGVKEKVTIKLTGGTITSAVSSNKKIATVNAKGVVTAVKVGTAKVTIVDNFGKSKVVTIVVKKAPKTLKANVTKKTLKIGKKFTIKPKFAKDCYSYQIKYSTSNKKVATVNSKGVVVAKKKGKATILLKTYNGKKAKVVVVVK